MASKEKVVKPTTNTAAAPAPTQAPAQVTIQVQQPAAPEVKAETPATESKDTGPNIDTLIPSDPYYMDPLFYEIANYFGLQQEDYASAKNKLSDIVDYIIREEKSNEPDVVLKAIRRLEEKIQPPAWDEKRYTNLHKYVRLASKEQTIRQAMTAFEKGGFNG